MNRGRFTPSRVEKRTVFQEKFPLELSNGQKLGPVEVAYQTYGQLNPSCDNVVLVCHALTGSAHVSDAGFQKESPLGPGWWNNLVNYGCAIDPEKHFILSTNFLGSCYGTTGPASINPETGRPYGPTFPEIDVRDMVRVQRRLLEILGITKIRCVIGGSLGGMQVLEWCCLYPEMIDTAVVIASAAQHSPWAMSFNESARLAITNDPVWQGGFYQEQPTKGLALARMIAMISYRSHDSFQQRFKREELTEIDPRRSPVFDPISQQYQIQNYLRYQGNKLVERFDANAYLTITRAMDRHDIARDRGRLENVLNALSMPVLCVGIHSDVLYPPSEQREIARMIPNAQYREIQSNDGHDAFLIEHDQLNKMIGNFFQ